MKRWSAVRTLVVAATLSLPTLVLAQESTGGRTDGPEGSEIGHGGYSRANSGVFSLQLDWGVALPSAPSTVPMLLGLTGSYWVDEWFLIDVSGFYVFDRRGSVLIGPRFRTVTYPVSGYLGVKAGAMMMPGLAAFGIAPQAGVDLVVRDHLILGLNYALDLVFRPTDPRGFPTGGLDVGHRIFMNVGYRF